MPPGERGRTPADFRAQLLQRLRNEVLRAGIPAQRLQQQIAFERLLAQLPPDDDWVLKGGFALQPIPSPSASPRSCTPTPPPWPG